MSVISFCSFNGVSGLFFAYASLMGSPEILFMIWLDKVIKTSDTFTESLAEVPRNLIPKVSANFIPSSVSTFLSDSRSVLLPKRSVMVFEFPCLATSSTHYQISLKDCLSEIS